MPNFEMKVTQPPAEVSYDGSDVTNHSQGRGGASRLIVLVVGNMTNLADLARKIHHMAYAQQKDVLYLTLLEDNEDELTATRWLATLEAVTRDRFLMVNRQIGYSHNWMAALHEIYRPGDQVVCNEEQTVRVSMFKSRPLYGVIEEELNTTVVTIAGYYQPVRASLSRWGRNFLFWLGCLLILVFFSWLEYTVDGQVNGLIKPVALVILLLSEIGLIWSWNGVMG